MQKFHCFVLSEEYGSVASTPDSTPPCTDGKKQTLNIPRDNFSNASNEDPQVRLKERWFVPFL